MRRLIAIVVATGTMLVAAGAAQAGCWATAGIEPPPKGVTAGETWPVTVIIRQHGYKPLAGAKPTVIVTNAATGARSVVQTRPTAKVGRYRANVVFPEAGTWRVAVNDGFPVEECAKTHTLGSFVIGSGGGDSASGVPWWPIALGTGLGAAALVALGFARLHASDRKRVAAG